jgi:hypothetical protein
MTWSYSGDPASTDKDAVRFYVGDTEAEDPQIGDEEILFLLVDESGDLIRAAARTAEAIAAKYARQVDKSVGGLSLSAAVRQGHYLELAGQLRSTARTGSGSGGGLPVPYAGGISQTDKDAKASDPDRVPPAFTKDMQDLLHMIDSDVNAG